jgi:hypothetical protein
MPELVPESQPSLAPPAAPTPAAPSWGPADVQAQIDTLMRSDAYAKGDRDAVDTMQQLYQLKTHGRVLEPELSDRPASITTPAGFDVPAHVVEDASATIREMGLGPMAQDVYAFFLGQGAAPSLPAAYQPPTREAAIATLQESEGRLFEHTVATADAALDVLEELRTAQGRPAGEVWRFLDQTGARFDPRVVRYLARLGGHFKVTEPQRMAAALRRPRAR